MARKPRRRRTAILAAYLITGAIVLQLGPVCATAANTAIVAFDFGKLVDAQGYLFGVFQVCGGGQTDAVTTPTGTISTNGNLIWDCPATTSTGG
jgi:hypothetical protein